MPLQFELCPGRMIGGDHPCFIIAEIGQNHQGDVEIAKKMIKMAKDCGADCAKFQKSELEYKFSKRALERPYNSKHSWGKTYGEHKRHLEFSHDQYRELKNYATENGIFLTASGMDEMAVEFLHELDVPFFKVASCDANNFPYLEKTAKKGRPMVVSTGMQSMETIRRVYNTVKAHNQNFTMLQCTSAYPLDPKDVNLKVIKEYQREFPDVPIGYSGHEQGIYITVAAVAMGAKVVERHVTLDKTWKGNDHEASLEPSELKELVRAIRQVEMAMGSPVKQMLPCEKSCHDKLGKSVVAKVAICKGTLLSLDMFAVKVGEPKGIPPENMQQLDCGADCAKFQKSELEYKFNKRALERPYTSKHSWGKTYGEHKRHLEFSHDQYKELQSYAKEVGIFFTASGMDESYQCRRPMVVSSGMQSMETMRRVYKTVKEHNQNFTILQCTSAYPLEAEDVNLRVITEYQKEFPDIPIGYSGHESGISISVAAVALGAKVIERHITLDKTWKGSDHAASLEPSELAELVRSIRLVERALGSGLKQMLPCEKPCHDKLGKSVVAKVKIPSGTVLTLDMLTVKVADPMGVAAEDIFQLVGKTVTEDVEEDESLVPGVVDSYGKRAKC
ncbi:hypothetical protein INR49_015401 [Caranx melampygus]|nr:hypothetical protein INR49_015401 [Caranx melampygus]